MATALTSDNTEIYYVTHGDRANPSVFLGGGYYASPNKLLIVADPTPRWLDALTSDFYVLVADYPRGMGLTGNPLGMKNSADVHTADVLAILDAEGLESVAYVGYSYGGAMGVQLACRCDRLSAVAIGGWPPLNAPFAQLTEMTTRTAKSPPPAAAVDPELLWSIVGFYAPLVEWPERTEVAKIAIPRMAFMGTNDQGQGGRSGSITPLADLLREAESDLKTMGWEINWLDGADHLGGFAAEVSAPVVHDFLLRALAR
jgi:pimeloyl-ACP methyl ester carboxylesterase